MGSRVGRAHDTRRGKHDKSRTQLQKNVIADLRGTLCALSASIERLTIIQHNFKYVSLRRLLAESRVWCPDRSLNNIAVCQGVGESTNRKGRTREETAK